MSTFQGWTEEHGSPIITEDATGGSIKLLYITTWQNLEVGKPELQSFYPGSLTKYHDHKLQEINSQSKPGGLYVGVELIYRPFDQDTAGQPSRSEGQAIYTMTSSVMEKDLEQHPNYKTIWKNNLIYKTTTTETVPSDYLTTTSKIISGKKEWSWIEDSDSRPETYSIYAEKTKKNEKSYLVPTVSVHKKIYYRAKTSASSAAATVGTIAAPGERFGLLGAGHWLVMSANVYYEDRWWVAEIDYQYASVAIDKDLY